MITKSNMRTKYQSILIFVIILIPPFNFFEQPETQQKSLKTDSINEVYCSEGCLFCLSPTSCGLCDKSFNWTLDSSSKKCVSSSSESISCQTLSTSGLCLQCHQGFYLKNEQCTAVPESNYISNCAWFTVNGCQICEKNYFFNGESCQEAGQRIYGCEYYSLRDFGSSCLACESGKALINGRCVDEVNSDDNCLHFVDFECKQCSSGFKPVFNKTLDLLFSRDSGSNFNIQDFFKSQVLEFYRPPAYFCSKIQIDNCEVYDFQGKCIQCDPEYSIIGDQCQQISEFEIPQCISYHTSTTCSQCASGFFLKSETECAPIIPHLFCSTYRVNSSECEECFNSFYLSQNETCMRRIYSRNITSCETYSKQQDTCETCQSGFQLSTDQLKCFPQVQNCEEYHPSNWQETSVRCRKCGSEYYLGSDGECIKGEVSNCKEFRLYQDICQECTQGYFLESSTKTCVKHEDNPACQSYDYLIRDKCNFHFANYREFEYMNRCIPVKPIERCTEYSRQNLADTLTNFERSTLGSAEFWATKTIASCLQCEPTFEPSDSKDSCVALTSVEHCKVINDSECIECIEGKVLSFEGKCVDPNPSLFSFCQNGFDSLVSSGCVKCDNNSLSLLIGSLSICVYDSTLNLPDVSVENCELYQTFSDNSKECISCTSGSSLDEETKTCKPDDQCLAVLKNPLFNYTLNSNENDQFYTYSEHALFNRTKSICLTEDQTTPLLSNCHTFAHGLLGKLACIKCKSGYLPVYSISNSPDTSEANYVKTDFTGTFISKVTSRQEISECVSSSSVQQVSYCEKYYRMQNNSIGCLTCEFGFSGKAHISENRIESCEDISSDQCDASIRREGLDWTSSFPKTLKFSLDSLFSCHECIDKNTIPLLSTSANFTPSSVSFAVSNSNAFSSQSANLQIECVSPTSQDLSDLLGMTVTSFPQNCALIWLNADTIKSGSAFAVEEFGCVACQPGFRAIRKLSQNSIFIESCEEIENCDTHSDTKWFNSCSQCLPNHAYPSSLTQSSHFDQCSISTDYFCETLNPSSLSCKQCLPNYILGPTGQCDNFQIEHCTSGFTSPQFDPEFDLTNIQDPMVFLPHKFQEIGCTECDQGFTAAFSKVNSSYICSHSKRISKRIFRSLGYDMNCSVFRLIGSVLTCLKCSSGYVWVFPSGECIQVPSLPHCKISFNGNRCMECQSGYVLNEANHCIKIIEDNCLESLQGVFPSKCIVCKDGFYNFKGICLPGNVSNCKSYHFKSQCKECDQGFLLFEKESGSECLKDNSKNNCLQTSVIQNNFEIFCDECSSAHLLTLKNETDPLFYYEKIADIDNCVAYSDESHILRKLFKKQFISQKLLFKIEMEFSDLISTESDISNYSSDESVCILCANQYYLDLNSNTCKKSEKTITNCETYSKLSDSCFKCMENYILNNDHTKCISHLKEISKCTQYESIDTCLVCTQSHYPVDSKCDPIPSEFKTQNCNSYNVNMNCVSCESGYLLVNNQCMTLQVSNCSEFVNHKQCKTCIKDHILHYSAPDIITCEPKTILYCVESQENEINQLNPITDSPATQTTWCIQCESGYFALMGTCHPVSKIIPNCNTYSSSTTCKHCSSGFFLNLSKRKCKPNLSISNAMPSLTNENYSIDPECSLLSHLESPTCLLCKQGYFVHHGLCRPCENDNCLQCNPQDSRKCEICKVGFSVGANSQCIKV